LAFLASLATLVQTTLQTLFILDASSRYHNYMHLIISEIKTIADYFLILNGTNVQNCVKSFMNDPLSLITDAHNIFDSPSPDLHTTPTK
jgi:hypothetical protein